MAESSSPDVVYGLYLGQPYEAYQRKMLKGNWECVANGFEGESLHPAAIYRCERGPKLREKLILVHDADRERLKRLLHAILKMDVKVQIKLPVVRFTEAVGVG